MSKLLLTEADFPKEGEPDLIFPKCCIALERFAYAEGAKAQAKKIFEFLDDKLTWDGYHFNDEEFILRSINQAEWETLEKEVEDA